MTTPEGNFQKKFIDKLKMIGFKCIRVKANGNSNKSYPDYAVFYKRFWAWLEFKKDKDAEHQPGQDENINWAMLNSYGKFIYPENAIEVMEALVRYKILEDNK